MKTFALHPLMSGYCSASRAATAAEILLRRRQRHARLEPADDAHHVLAVALDVGNRCRIEHRDDVERRAVEVEVLRQARR